MEKIDNSDLIKLARNGDSSAFEELVRQNYVLVYKISYKWCGVKEDAEDITQEVFVKLARKIGSFKEASAFQTWLYRMVINTAKDFAKKDNARQKNESMYFKEKRLESIAKLDEMNIAERLHQLIEQLPQKLKEAALLVFSEGMNHREAAEVLDCAEKTISWRIFEVKKRLKKYFNHEEVMI